MKTTSAGIWLLRGLFLSALFFAACCFADSWHEPFFLNIGRRGLKLFLAFLLPFLSTLLVFIAERNLNFIGKGAACIMGTAILGYFADRLFFNLIARIGADKIIYHFVYSMVAFFAVFLAGWLCRAFSKKAVPFAGFCRDFFTGYAVFAVFLFILMFIVVRSYNRTDIIQNFVPFRGEIGRLTRALQTGSQNTTMLLHSAGNVLFFSTISLTVCALDQKERLWPALLIPVCLSVFVETYQYLTRCGDTDVDDILLNTLGALAGILLYRLLIQRFMGQTKQTKKTKPTGKNAAEPSA